jgi:hypothetical protein
MSISRKESARASCLEPHSMDFHWKEELLPKKRKGWWNFVLIGINVL